jgi:hypothetical protein
MDLFSSFSFRIASKHLLCNDVYILGSAAQTG